MRYLPHGRRSRSHDIRCFNSRCEMPLPETSRSENTGSQFPIPPRGFHRRVRINHRSYVVAEQDISIQSKSAPLVYIVGVNVRRCNDVGEFLPRGKCWYFQKMNAAHRAAEYIWIRVSRNEKIRRQAHWVFNAGSAMHSVIYFLGFHSMTFVKHARRGRNLRRGDF